MNAADRSTRTSRPGRSAASRGAGLVLLSARLLLAGEPESVALLAETRGNLEGQWRFATDPQEVGETEGWQQPGFADAAWRQLRVPGSWEPQGITEPRPGQAPKPKGNLPWTDYDGVAWYRCQVVIPAAWADQPLVLDLGHVDDEDRTFLNGRLIGATGPGIERAVTHRRRYPIPADAVRFGAPNSLAIRVRDLGGPGGLDGPELSLLPERSLTVKPLPPEERPLTERFADPPGSTRILKIVHGWPPTQEAETAQFEMLSSQGFGGVVTNVAWGDDYLGNEAAWAQLQRVVAQAQQLNMALWLYDEKGYPSGTAGGQVLAGHPEWLPEGLLVAAARADGPIELRVPPGELVRAVAWPADQPLLPGQTTELSGSVAAGVLKWTPPGGTWQVVVLTVDRIYEGTHAAMNVFRHQPYVNLLLPEATARFLELTHAAYARRLGQDLGAIFQATFTDEPSLMSAFLSPMPYAVLPWAANLPAEFARRRGYALEPWLAALAVDAGPPAAAKARYDYWLTVAELVEASFVLPIRDWCRAHRVPSGGHLLWEEGLRMHVPFYGDFFRCIRGLDAPSIDCLTSLPPQVPWAVARLVCSAAELEGRTLTMSETSDHAQRYRPPGDKRPVQAISALEIRGTVNRLLVGGINTITSYYSFAGLTTAELQALNQYVGRCCTVLRGGHQVADIAVVYPIESLWPHYEPASHQATRNPVCVQIEESYRGALESLFSAGRDLTIIDSRAVVAAAVDGATLRHGALRWSVVVLPAVETLPLAAWERIAGFYRAGGAVVALSLRPANSATEFPSPQVEALATELFGPELALSARSNAGGGVAVFLPPGAEALLPAVLTRLLAPDVTIPAGAPLRVTHRRIDDQEVYFLINDGPAPWTGPVQVAAEGAAERWDPKTGGRSTLAGNATDVTLEPYDSVLLRYARSRERPRRAWTAAGGLGLPEPRPLPDVKPTIGAGEHVAAEPMAELDPSGGFAGWRTVGQLRKGGVDTFLFLCFRYPEPVDVGDTEGLELQFDIPAGQNAGATLHVIVTEADKGQFLASMGRTVRQAGRYRTWVPWSRLHPAGWCKEGDGVLDRTRITEVHLGWGGYTGTAGERIEVHTAAPRVTAWATAAP